MKRTWKVIIPLILSFVLLGCQAVTQLRVPVASVQPIVGRVTDLATPRSVQATIDDVANGATVSLIDTITGQTVGTTVTDANGRFSLSFGSGFKPGNQPYYMEAVKGLPVGGSANRAGASVARVRTILYFNSGWTSLNSSIQNGPVYVNTASTALCDIISLRGLSAAPFVGSLAVTTFSPPIGSTISSSEYNTVLGLVGPLLASDEDPVEAIGYDSTLGQPYFARPGSLVIYNTVTPSVVSAGGSATFYGQNFPSTGSVLIGQLPVASWSINAARTQLFVTLPPNGYSGVLKLSNGISTWFGPFLGVHGTVGTLAGSGYAADIDGYADSGSLNQPYGLAMDAQGNLTIGESNGRRIRKLTPTGNLSTLAGNLWGYVDGSGLSAQLANPGWIAMDAGGNVYVADIFNNRIRKVTPAGVVTTYAGTGATGYTLHDADGGALTNAQFNNPTGIALDSAGNLYVSDLDQLIRKISPSGAVTTLAGSPSVTGYADGASSSALFSGTWGSQALTVDASGNLYMADANNHRIRKITPTGFVSTYAGAGVGMLDGATSSALFRVPQGVALDAKGDLYVADSGNHRIREITPSGIVLTVAGGGIAGFLDGATSSAQFNDPYGLIVDASGDIYVADTNNNKIRVITP